MNRHSLFRSRSQGFTLVELMMVIVVIVILATLVGVAYRGAQARAQDTRRLTDMKAITKALDMYKIKNGSFPIVEYGAGTSYYGWESSSMEPTGEFLKAIGTEYYGFAKGVAADPQNNTAQGYMYLYYVYPAGGSGCDASRGDYYVLGIVRSSTTRTSPMAGSPGFSCSGRDWQTEFAWVTGGYTR